MPAHVVERLDTVTTTDEHERLAGDRDRADIPDLCKPVLVAGPHPASAEDRSLLGGKPSRIGVGVGRQQVLSDHARIERT